jgi:hypothetical protein
MHSCHTQCIHAHHALCLKFTDKDSATVVLDLLPWSWCYQRVQHHTCTAECAIPTMAVRQNSDENCQQMETPHCRGEQLQNDVHTAQEVKQPACHLW